MYRFYITFVEDDNYTICDEIGIVAATSFSEAIKSLEEWYGTIEEVRLYKLEDLLDSYDLNELNKEKEKEN